MQGQARLQKADVPEDSQAFYDGEGVKFVECFTVRTVGILCPGGNGVGAFGGAVEEFNEEVLGTSIEED